MKKRSFFVLTITLVIVSLTIFQNQAKAQYFNKYYTWASEKHMWPGANRFRLPFAYDSIKFAIKGNFSGFRYHSIDIPAVAYLIRSQDNRLLIHTVESRGFRIYDPIFDYGRAIVTSQQEGISLDSIIYQNGSGDTIYAGAYTEHPTLNRFEDSTNIFTNVDSIKFAVSGNFYGGKKDEIMVVYNNPNGQQQFFFFKVNQPGDTLNYQFEIDANKTISLNSDSIPISSIVHVVSGNFDDDSLSEVQILTHYYDVPYLGVQSEHNKQYLLDWDNVNTRWNITLLYDFRNWEWNNANVIHAVSGDFCGGAKDEIACFYSYGDDSASTQRLFVMRDNWNWFAQTYYSGTKYAMDWKKISNAVAGNFAVDTTDKESLAIFYDPGTASDTTGERAVQKVFFTNHTEPDWTITPHIFEHRDNMSFSKDKLRFAVAGNFDYDTKGRDDLLGIYLGEDRDGQDQYTFKKALLWTCLPPFEENDFMIYADYHGDTLRWDPALGRYEYDSAQVKGNFIPLGTWGGRLATTYIDPATGQIADSICHNNTEHFQAGKIPERDIEKFATIFNCVVADRETFTDHDNIWVADKRKVRNTSSDFYDGYMNGFNNYLDAAQRHHLKVIPEPIINHLWNYDDFVRDTLWSGDKVYCNFSDFSTYPEYYKNLYTDSSGSPRFHPSLLGWFYADEPTSIYCRRVLDTNDNDLVDYNVQFIKHQGISLTQDSILNTVNNVYKNTPVASIDGTHSLVKIVNFDKGYDMDYYADGYDVAMCDDGYLFKYADKSKGIEAHYLTWKINNLCKYVYNSVVRNNKTAGMYIPQGMGASGPGVPKEKIRDWINPTIDDLRFSLFNPAIDGIRGFIFFHHNDMMLNDTVNGRVFLACAEFKNYMHIFMQKPLYTSVNSNLDRLHKSDYTWDGASTDGWEKPVNYCLIKDSVDNIYYLFVSSCHYDPQSIEFTINVDPGTPNAVNELAPDYHKNGLYDNISRTYDASGQYFKFSTKMTLNKVRIFTIGGLPTLRKKTIADSVGLKGYLSYSNQRKLIAYPARQNSNSDYGSTDTVRYHAVYHKIIPGTGRWGVYYRRSHQMVRRYPQDMIDWEPNESLVSHTITVDPASPFGRDTLCDCKYPSLVVRYDSLGQFKPMTYIVYSCNKSTFDPSPYYSIVEKMLPANDPIQVNDSIGTIIATYPKCDFDKYGTPTINASYGGNYYAWSDSIKGIRVGWKAPNAMYFDTASTPFLNIRWNAAPPPGTVMNAMHPSLNTYSRIGLGETGCALVWQEEEMPYSAFDEIYYTRIMKDGNTIRYCLPNSFVYVYPTLNPTRTIMNLTDGSLFLQQKENRYPTIYRSVEDYPDYMGNDNENGYNPRQCKLDRVYWETYDGITRTTSVYMKALNSIDGSINVVDWMELYNPFHIRSIAGSVSQPSISQGCLSMYAPSDTSNLEYGWDGDSIVVVNVNSGNRIWQINHSYQGFFRRNSYDETLESPVTTYAKPLIGSGSHPQLAAMPAVLGRGEWLANRRLFETSFGTPPEIASSLQYFYKRSVEDTLKESSMPFLGFIRDSVPGMISRFRVTDVEKEISFTPTFETHKKKDHYYLPADTIVSNWFKMKDLSTISFYTFAKAPEFIALQLERKKDGHLISLPIEYRGDTAYVYHEYSFIGSKNDKYRLKVIKKAREAHYFEEMLLGGLNGGVFEAAGDTSGGILFKAGAKLYNLQSESESVAVTAGDKFDFTLYPNPAATEIFVRCNYPAEFLSHGDESTDACVELTLYNSLGQGFGAYKSSLGGFVRIDVSGLQPGLYYVKGKVVSRKYVPETPQAAVSKPVIITR